MGTIIKIGILKTYKFNFKKYLFYYKKQKVWKFSLADLSMMELANLKEIKELRLFNVRIIIYTTLESKDVTKKLSTTHYTGKIFMIFYEK